MSKSVFGETQTGSYRAADLRTGTRSMIAVCYVYRIKLYRINIYSKRHGNAPKLHLPSQNWTAFKTNGFYTNELVIIYYPSPQCI